MTVRRARAFEFSVLGCLLATIVGCGGGSVSLDAAPTAPELGMVASESHGLLALGAKPTEDGGPGLVRPGRQLFSGSPMAVPLPDGRVVYNSWAAEQEVDPYRSMSQQGLETGEVLGRPSLRILDPSSGEDEVLADGSQSVAVSGSGQLAYARGKDPDYRLSTPWANEVVVRGSVDSDPVVWAEPDDRGGEYTVLGWAGDRLIVELARPTDGDGKHLLALGGPGSVRDLGTGLGFLAISPDGTTVLVGTDQAFLVDDEWQLKVMDVSSGAVHDLGDPSGGVKLYGATWVDGMILAAGASYVDDKAGRSRFVVFDTSRESGVWRIDLRAVIEVDPEQAMPPTDVWLASDGQTIVSVGTPPLPRNRGRLEAKPRVLIQCPAPHERCTYEDLPLMSDEQVGRVYNPSRPSGATLGYEGLVCSSASSYPWSEVRYRSEGCIKVASTGTPVSAGGHIREVYDSHHIAHVPEHLVVW